PSSPAAPLPCFSFCCSGHPAHLPSCPTRRSSDLGRKWAEGAAYGAALGAVLGGVIGCLVALGRVAEPDSIWLMLMVSMFAGVGLDRKSTRLNSSHVKISYAVFCLKKKNTSTSRHS